MVREFHDVTADSGLAAGTQRVVCHNDLDPRNTVYATEAGEWRPTGFIDWDLAAPGRRVDDVAHVCWQYLDLGPAIDDVPEASLPPAAPALRRVRPDSTGPPLLPAVPVVAGPLPARHRRGRRRGRPGDAPAAGPGAW
ncbi:phosphotransferase family protein [Streptomyces sp. KL116D]|uniref:phosphotransferase family protein n=1 Tax=Streptomyces sp. KL116D TaxID=3045152 RepID=UPI0035565B60